MKRINLYLIGLAIASFALSSCGTSGGEFQGREYMPDMAHSIAYEANHYTYYEFNTWGGEEAYRNFAEPGEPVAGTVPFDASKVGQDSESLTYPRYRFADTEDDRTKATEMILDNPIRPTTDEELKKVLDKGKNLYNIMCSSCHGEKGDGNGKLYNQGEGPYPAAPANYLTDEFINATAGRYYHAIMHGKGVMLSHADKLNHDERWMVIHYIRSMQAKSKDQKYTLEAAQARKGVKEKNPEEGENLEEGENPETEDETTTKDSE